MRLRATASVAIDASKLKAVNNRDSWGGELGSRKRCAQSADSEPVDSGIEFPCVRHRDMCRRDEQGADQRNAAQG
jgi:hypothetical protein